MRLAGRSCLAGSCGRVSSKTSSRRRFTVTTRFMNTCRLKCTMWVTRCFQHRTHAGRAEPRRHAAHVRGRGLNGKSHQTLGRKLCGGVVPIHLVLRALPKNRYAVATVNDAQNQVTADPMQRHRDRQLLEANTITRKIKDHAKLVQELLGPN